MLINSDPWWDQASFSGLVGYPVPLVPLCDSLPRKFLFEIVHVNINKYRNVYLKNSAFFQREYLS